MKEAASFAAVRCLGAGEISNEFSKLVQGPSYKIRLYKMTRQALIHQFVVTWSSSRANLIFNLVLDSAVVSDKTDPLAVMTMAVYGTCGHEPRFPEIA